MKLTQSVIADQTIRYLQQHQQTKVTAADIFQANNFDNLEFDNSIKAIYESMLNQLVRKDLLKVTVYPSDIFGTKQYYFEAYQIEAMNRKGWKVNG